VKRRWVGATYREMSSARAARWAARARPFSVMDDCDTIERDQGRMSNDKINGFVDLDISGICFFGPTVKSIASDLNNSNHSMRCRYTICLAPGYYKVSGGSRAYVFVCSSGMVTGGRWSKFTTTGQYMIAFRSITTLIDNMYLGNKTFGSEEVVQYNNFIGSPQQHWDEEANESEDFEEID
jgi:hypothetical protein